MEIQEDWVGGTQVKSFELENKQRRIICPKCKEEYELPSSVVQGQHLLCTLCNTKFSY
jgi:formylmethanofuran dehydrogenase subunit E